ncbi:MULTISPECIES: DUF3618 domain-containing protein [unclassified Micromonospora]|uniref:DUF3618 domain-containing protein n=1 Tax=unclassified Micromonospora TaxID=2617518 RepID=UPI001C2259BB|nr:MULTISPECIES: DUF3618 domain-containing protein [unclassified Micromonospora]MBU8855815.1 DUF3618 domain-containing protein [Micromonospora sp. WMMB482]MBU8861834.1 DUF3618 domain-containing protein [Micromonospora sp. WMMB482]MDM4781414.1 DUF3618 domain-containing protein [Micromonospora sp. b486]
MSESTPTDPQQLRAEIAQTRAALGDTVEALAARTDVKARAKAGVEDAAAQAREKVTTAAGRIEGAAGAVPLAVVGAAAVLAVLVALLVRRRRA